MLIMSETWALVMIASLILGSLADPTDWVNPRYVQKSSAGGSTTSDAQAAIIRGAGITAAQGPWVLTKAKILPPSQDARDYFSWAPYHWPDCNWCGSSHTSEGQSSPSKDDGSQDDDSEDIHRRQAPTATAPVASPATSVAGSVQSSEDDISISFGLSPTSSPSNAPSSTITDRATPTSLSVANSGGSQSSTRIFASDSTAPDAQFAGKTSSASSSKCTPSPTKSLAPSATWTSCPYKVLDGKRNPDVRQLEGVDSVVAVTQSVFYNAIAFVLTGNPAYSRNASSFIDAFFINPKSGMNPNVNFGQVVRGPGHQRGQFMGVLDLRGMMKVVNAVLLLRSAQSPEWNHSRDAAMISWAKTYVNWLQTSDIGKAAAASVNNHCTFFHGQLAALQILVGDEVGARQTIKQFITGAFGDQIASNGEQPWEAVRTRPFHYRCFNLEALFALGKIADQLSLNIWVAKSKHSATIQDAVDFTMSASHAGEDVTELAPHVAAAMAIYGDLNGRYAKYLSQVEPNFKSRPFWYYDQPSAFMFSTAIRSKRMVKMRREQDFQSYNMSAIYPSCLTVDNGTDSSCTNPIPPTNVTEPDKPAVFYSFDTVQLDDDAFVTWDELRPYYPAA